MAQASSIEWTQATWNPIAGCAVVSPGCTNCYAMKMAARHEAMSTALGRVSPYDGLTKKTKAGAVWNGEMRLVESALRLPLTWRKPKTIFVNSMSDLFADGVPDSWRDMVWAVMAAAPWHTYQILTKRAEAMRDYVSGLMTPEGLERLLFTSVDHPTGRAALIDLVDAKHLDGPLPNVWLGASIEDQDRLEQRGLALAETPAAVRFISAEPLLGALDLNCIKVGPFNRHLDLLNGIITDCNGNADLVGHVDLVIVGGESGHKSRACWVPDVRSIVLQCESFGVPVFVKQLGANVQDRNDAGLDGCGPMEWPDIDPADVEHDLNGFRDGYQGAPVRVHLRDRKGADMEEWPEDLRIRQLPEAAHA